MSRGPGPAKAWIWFSLWVLPALAIVTFATTILVPRLEMIREKSGIQIKEGLPLDFFVSAIRFSQTNFLIFALIFCGVLLLPEILWHQRPRRRFTYLSILAFLTNLLSLIYLALIATVALIFIPGLLE